MTLLHSTGCRMSSGLARLDKHIRSDSLFNSAFTGFVLFDPHSGQTLAQHHAHHHFTPASNTKIATLCMVLETLGDSMPLARYRIEGDTLFFSGTANPINLNPYIHDNRQLTDWLSDWQGPTVYVPARPAAEAYGPGWAWDDYLYYYQLENYSLPVFGNELRIIGQNDEFIIYPSALQDSIRVIPVKGQSSLERSPWKNDFQVNTDGRPFDWAGPFHLSDELVCKLLSEVIGKPVTCRETSFTKEEWRTLRIQFTDSLLVLMMQDSDNFIAEQLLLMSALEGTDTLSRAMAIEMMQEKWREAIPDSIRWVDGSGLSRYNLFTPMSLVWLLDRILNLKGFDWITQIFARGSTSGTIRNWYGPYVFAKTGSLSNNHNLSGYIMTASGRILIFSFMHNHFLAHPDRYKTHMDDLLRRIHEEY